jgi:hypothetical protein
MKMRTVSIAILAGLFALPALANGPMAEDPGMSSNSNSNSGQMNPGREQWTRKRIQHLKQRRVRYHKEGYPGGDVRDGMGGAPDNPYLTNDEAALRRRDAIKRQHDIDTMELLMLKKERGELSPGGQKKLNQLMRHYTR